MSEKSGSGSGWPASVLPTTLTRVHFIQKTVQNVQLIFALCIFLRSAKTDT